MGEWRSTDWMNRFGLFPPPITILLLLLPLPHQQEAFLQSPNYHHLVTTISKLPILFANVFFLAFAQTERIMLFSLLLLLHWTKSTTLKNLFQVLHEVLRVGKRISRIQVLARFHKLRVSCLLHHPIIITL